MKIKKVIIGIDNSMIAEHAAQYGFELAAAFKADVGLVHVIEPAIMQMGGGIDPMGSIALQDISPADIDLIEIENAASKKLVDHITQKFGAGLTVKHFTEFGDTADGIIEACAEFEADVIVVGTHSRTGLDRLIMGSVAEHVMRHATVPVFVVPLPNHEE